MFGMKKKMKRQLNRAATIENCLLAGIFDYVMASRGHDAGKELDRQEAAIIAGTAHWILGIGIEEQVLMFGDDEIATEKIQACANTLLRSDERLERLVVRCLYEIKALSLMLDNDQWAQECVGKHIRIMEILNEARPKWPELFRDISESLFKSLFIDYIDKYMPDMKNSTSKLFH